MTTTRPNQKERCAKCDNFFITKNGSTYMKVHEIDGKKYHTGCRPNQEKWEEHILYPLVFLEDGQYFVNFPKNSNMTLYVKDIVKKIQSQIAQAREEVLDEVISNIEKWVNVGQFGSASGAMMQKSVLDYLNSLRTKQTT